jgi:tRNA dimethylallyltransferase
VLLTGEPFAATLPSPTYVIDDTVQIGLSVPRDRLDQRIDHRVTVMWQSGFVDEVRRLEAAGLRQGRTASRALGYAQVLRFLAGQGTEEAAKAETIRATRRFARRQDSWFRRDPRVTWLAYDRPDLLDAAVAVVRSAVPS